MQEAPPGALRVHGHGEVEVDLVVEYLADFTHAYNSILVFDTALDDMERQYSRYPNLVYVSDPWFLVGRRGSRLGRGWIHTREEIASLVPASERLILAGVELHSPGAWDFLGKLNPLEVIRQYLNDRHERRKDHEYRESAEARRLKLENLRLENEVIAGRVKLAKEMGATERDLAPLLNELVYRPLGMLDRHQDRGVIERADPPKQLPNRRQ
jgi:hypothetical protein